MLEFLEMRFECTAEWREDVALRYPDDIRNVDAARVFKRLAETVKDVSGARAEQYEAIWDEDANDRTGEVESEMLGSIYPSWETAEDFIADLVERVARR